MSSWKTLFEPLWSCIADDDSESFPGEESVKEEDVDGEEEEEFEMGHLSHLNSFDFKGV